MRLTRDDPSDVGRRLPSPGETLRDARFWGVVLAAVLWALLVVGEVWYSDLRWRECRTTFSVAYCLGSL